MEDRKYNQFDHFQYYETVKISRGRNIFIKRLNLQEAVIFSGTWNAYLKTKSKNSERELLRLCFDSRVPAFINQSDKSIIFRRAREFNFPAPKLGEEGNTAENPKWVAEILSFFMLHGHDKENIVKMYPSEIPVIIEEMNKQESNKNKFERLELVTLLHLSFSEALLRANGWTGNSMFYEAIEKLTNDDNTPPPPAKMDEAKVDALIARQNRMVK